MDRLPATLRVTLFLLFSLSATVQAAGAYEVLILHAYSQEYPWTKSQHEGFVSEFLAGTDAQVNFSTEYLDTKRRAFSADYAAAYAHHLRQKYAGYSPDVIYVTDDNGYLFARDYLVEMFPGAPVFFSGVNDYSIISQGDSLPIRGVFEKKEISKNLALLDSVDGQDTEILVVGDGSNTYAAIEHEVKQELLAFPGITAAYVSSDRLDRLSEVLETRDEIYLFLTTIGGIKDASGNSIPLENILSDIVAAGDFAVFSMEDAYLHDGVVGGYVTSGHAQGQAAAGLALEFQRGAAIRDVAHVTDSPNAYIFNYQELRRQGITLPERIRSNATFINFPPSFYARNRNLILSLVAALGIAVIVLLTVVLLIRSGKNKQIRLALHETSENAKSLERLTAALTAAQEVSSVGIWEWHLDTGQMDWSQEFYAMLGLDPAVRAPGVDVYLSCVDHDDVARVDKAIKRAARDKCGFRIEHAVVGRPAVTRYARLVGSILETGNNRDIMTLTLLDVSTRRRAELLEADRVSRIERYQDALLEWSGVDYQHLGEALRKATEISVKTLQVARASIWLYGENDSSIVCRDMFVQGHGHIDGQVLQQTDFPRYFEALAQGRPLSIRNARTDPTTSEFAKVYLQPNDIHAMLDVPIFYQGKAVGVVCHEHTGDEREWIGSEQDFASAIASAVSLSLEVDKRRHMEQRLEYMAYHDALTGLPNRSLLMDRIEQSIRQADRSESLLAVLFIDLDNFKQINDSFGHAVGDKLLVQIAQRLGGALREVDTISRLGGDEFILLISPFSGVNAINDIALKLFDSLREPIVIEEQELYVTSSMGVSVYPNDGTDAETLLRNADAAMYRAKEEGRNGFQFYTEDMTERAFEKVLMISNIRRGLDRGEFEVHYQPQYDVAANEVLGLEALIRWLHPELGMVAPAKFIPAAEESGLIIPIDRWVMRESMLQMRRWRDSGLFVGRLSLNLAMQQLDQPDLLEFIRGTLDETGCRGDWIAFEVTEGQIMKKPEHSIDVLNKISELGIEIAVDDFGTGYSSLTYLKKLPVDTLKIDRSFVRDVPVDEDDVAIVRAVIALARSMRIDVLAEGVENVAQLEFLRGEGCNRFQGYYFAKPMTANEIPMLVETRIQISG